MLKKLTKFLPSPSLLLRSTLWVLPLVALASILSITNYINNGCGVASADAKNKCWYDNEDKAVGLRKTITDQFGSNPMVVASSRIDNSPSDVSEGRQTNKVSLGNPSNHKYDQYYVHENQQPNPTVAKLPDGEIRRGGYGGYNNGGCGTSERIPKWSAQTYINNLSINDPLRDNDGYNNNINTTGVGSAGYPVAPSGSRDSFLGGTSHADDGETGCIASGYDSNRFLAMAGGGSSNPFPRLKNGDVANNFANFVNNFIFFGNQGNFNDYTFWGSDLNTAKQMVKDYGTAGVTSFSNNIKMKEEDWREAFRLGGDHFGFYGYAMADDFVALKANGQSIDFNQHSANQSGKITYTPQGKNLNDQILGADRGTRPLAGSSRLIKLEGVGIDKFQKVHKPIQDKRYKALWDQSVAIYDKETYDCAPYSCNCTSYPGFWIGTTYFAGGTSCSTCYRTCWRCKLQGHENRNQDSHPTGGEQRPYWRRNPNSPPF